MRAGRGGGFRLQQDIMPWSPASSLVCLEIDCFSGRSSEATSCLATLLSTVPLVQDLGQQLTLALGLPSPGWKFPGDLIVEPGEGSHFFLRETGFSCLEITRNPWKSSGHTWRLAPLACLPACYSA